MFRAINGDLNNLLGGVLKDLENNLKQQPHQLLADIKETETAFIVLADAPGIKKEDIKITFEENVLKIETPQRDLDTVAEGEKLVLTQRPIAKQVGYFKIRQNVDKDSIKAVYRDGVLSVEIQKKEKEVSKTVTVE